jgi:hypothetical protein
LTFANPCPIMCPMNATQNDIDALAQRDDEVMTRIAAKIQAAYSERYIEHRRHNLATVPGANT